MAISSIIFVFYLGKDSYRIFVYSSKRFRVLKFVDTLESSIGAELLGYAGFIQDYMLIVKEYSETS